MRSIFGRERVTQTAPAGGVAGGDLRGIDEGKPGRGPGGLAAFQVFRRQAVVPEEGGGALAAAVALGADGRRPGRCRVAARAASASGVSSASVERAARRGRAAGPRRGRPPARTSRRVGQRGVPMSLARRSQVMASGAGMARFSSMNGSAGSRASAVASWGVAAPMLRGSRNSAAPVNAALGDVIEVSRAAPAAAEFAGRGAAGSARSGGERLKERAMSEAAAEAGTAGAGAAAAAGRRGGRSARRARVEAAPFIRRRIPNYEILDEEGLALIEANAETVLEEIGRALRRQPRGAGALARAPGRTCAGDRVHLPKGLAREPLRHGAAGVRAARAEPGAERHDRRQGAGAGAGLRAAVRARHGEGAALCDDRGFPQLREARLHVEVAAPLGRDGLRADRHRGQQAASRHAAGAHDAQRTSRSWAA